MRQYEIILQSLINSLMVERPGLDEIEYQTGRPKVVRNFGKIHTHLAHIRLSRFVIRTNQLPAGGTGVPGG